MIRYKKYDDVTAVQMDLDLTCYAEIRSDKPERYFVRSAFDDHVIVDMHQDKLSINAAVTHDRLLYFLKQKNR